MADSNKKSESEKGNTPLTDPDNVGFELIEEAIPSANVVSIEKAKKLSK